MFWEFVWETGHLPSLCKITQTSHWQITQKITPAPKNYAIYDPHLPCYLTWNSWLRLLVQPSAAAKTASEGTWQIRKRYICHAYLCSRSESQAVTTSAAEHSTECLCPLARTPWRHWAARVFDPSCDDYADDRRLLVQVNHSCPALWRNKFYFPTDLMLFAPPAQLVFGSKQPTIISWRYCDVDSKTPYVKLKTLVNRAARATGPLVDRVAVLANRAPAPTAPPVTGAGGVAVT